MKPRGPRAETLDVHVSPRRIGPVLSVLLPVLLVGLLAGPASAGVEIGPWKRVGNVSIVSQLAVAPQPVVLPSEPSGEITPAQRDGLRYRLELALGGSTATTLSASVDVEGYGAVLRRDATRALPPASTQKSFVGLSALLALGPDARYRTEVASVSPPAAGRVQGHVWLVAGGDPYLTSGYLRLLARSVRAAGVTTITGDVALDDMRYDQQRTAAGWKSSFMPGQSGPLSALAVDGNRWRSDDAFLADPAFPAAVLFRDYLRAEGVTVSGIVRRGNRPAGAHTLAVHNGTPLPAAVHRALKESDNFAAELLLKELGHVVRGNGSSADGLDAVREVLGRHAVPVGVGSDGSGLSSHDRQSTSGQVQLLRVADDVAEGPAFRASLPIGCRDGTLKWRFCETPAEGRVSAKTGTLSGVRALAGYTRTASGRDVWFAFQLTGVTDGARALTALDRAVVVLAGSTD